MEFIFSEPMTPSLGILSWNIKSSPLKNGEMMLSHNIKIANAAITAYKPHLPIFFVITSLNELMIISQSTM